MSNNRNKKILISLNEKEFAVLESLAKRKKMNKSQVIRDLIKKRATNKKITEFEKIFEAYSEIYLVLSRVCGNINQLAHHLNAGNLIADASDFFSLGEEMKEITKIFMQRVQEDQKKVREII